MNRFTPIVAGLLLAGAYPSLAGDPVMAEQAQLMTHLKHIVGTADDGRSPGSPTSIKAINYSDAKLKEYGFKTYRQDFVWGDTTKLGPVNPNHSIFIPADYKTRKCTNIIALKAGEDPKFKDHFIVLIAHTDGQGKGVASELVPSAAIVAGAKDPKSATPLLLTGAIAAAARKNEAFAFDSPRGR